jgi:hypothetical protein
MQDSSLRGTAIRSLREIVLLSQQKFAQITETAIDTIKSCESGRIKTLSVDLLIKLGRTMFASLHDDGQWYVGSCYQSTEVPYTRTFFEGYRKLYEAPTNLIKQENETNLIKLRLEAILEALPATRLTEGLVRMDDFLEDLREELLPDNEALINLFDETRMMHTLDLDKNTQALRVCRDYPAAAREHLLHYHRKTIDRLRQIVTSSLPDTDSKPRKKTPKRSTLLRGK